jgi:hypothetical protein
MGLLMHALFGAKERTLEEYRSLAGAAGLEVVAARPLAWGMWLVELALQPRGRRSIQTHG